MATITAAGSGSGLDIETIISQLVSLEKIPLTNQQAVTKKLNTQISDLGNLKSNLSALKTAAQALSSVDFLSSVKSSSSDATAVTVAANGTAKAGTYSVNVTQLASAKSEAYSLTTGTSSDPLGVTGSINITGMGKSIDVVATDTLDSLVNKINAKGSETGGVTASLIKQGDGNYAMVLMGRKTGQTAGDFTVTGLDTLLAGKLKTTPAGTDSNGNPVPAWNGITTTAAKDAIYSLNGIALTSASNEISGVASGLTITLNKVGASNLTVSSDTDAITKKVQTFVDAYNKVITNATSLKDTNGSFKGDGMMRSLMSGLYQSIYQPVSTTTTSSTLATKDAYAPLTALGISLGEGNKLTFDSTKFQTALKNDAAGVAKVFADGPATALSKTVNDYLNSSGLVGNRSDMLDQRLKTSKDNETRISDQVDAKAVKIRAQYTALDVALAKMKASLSSMQSMLGTSSN